MKQQYLIKAYEDVYISVNKKNTIIFTTKEKAGLFSKKQAIDIIRALLNIFHFDFTLEKIKLKGGTDFGY